MPGLDAETLARDIDYRQQGRRLGDVGIGSGLTMLVVPRRHVGVRSLCYWRVHISSGSLTTLGRRL